MWTGIPSPWATSWQSASIIAVEKSRLEFRICDIDVRIITSAISSAMVFNRLSTTATVIGSGLPPAPMSVSTSSSSIATCIRMPP